VFPKLFERVMFRSNGDFNALSEQKNWSGAEAWRLPTLGCPAAIATGNLQYRDNPVPGFDRIRAYRAGA
jgi:hypothetical protein